MSTLTAEHQAFLSTVLDRGEAEIAREIMLASGTMPSDPRLGHKTWHVPLLNLEMYVSEATPPSRVHRGLFKGYTDVLGNDQLGCCGEAMTLHGIEGIKHAAGQAPPPFVTADSLKLYTEVSGFNPNDGPPGNNPTDQGTDNAQLVSYWRDNGVLCSADGSVHQIVASVAVDATNTAHCQAAVYEFGALFCAWALPLSAQGQRTWTVVGDGRTGDSAPASWGYHDTVAMAYTGETFDIDTWGVWTPVTGPFRKTYQAGFFVVVTQDMLTRRGVGPSGVDWTKLNSDVRGLNSGQPIQ